jgi:hypothetical protein
MFKIQMNIKRFRKYYKSTKNQFNLYYSNYNKYKSSIDLNIECALPFSTLFNVNLPVLKQLSSIIKGIIELILDIKDIIILFNGVSFFRLLN